ncbi:MAG TPA: condensation domain-containing protein, partial [Chitinophagaceae bacterium]|nr:condensation domain-containing protein [Chitinophagaceae bacterium]
AYWQQKLADVAPLQLPTDHIRPAVQSTRGSAVGFRIDKHIADQLKDISQKAGATLYMSLLAAFKLLLHRYSGQQDICVGAPVAGRRQQEVESLVGFFVNTLALRTHIDSGLTFLQLLNQVRTTTLEAYEHEDVPFEKVVEAVVKDRDLSRSPLFQVVFVLQNAPATPELVLGETMLEQYASEHVTTHFDLTLSITETDAGLINVIEYCTDLFEQDTIVRMGTHYAELLRSIVQLPEQEVGAINMLPKDERHKILKEFNNTASPWPQDKSIVDVFEEQVNQTPAAIALVFEEEELTYKELDQRTNQLAHYLVKQGVSKGDLVAICMERSAALITGILGILKAGAAYVPIDPEYPRERISYMLKDTGVRVV